MKQEQNLHPLLKTWEDAGTTHLDVRPLLEVGGEPYAYIMDFVQAIQSGHPLVVHALFEPKPLIRQIARMGLTTRCWREAEDHWQLEISTGNP